MAQYRYVSAEICKIPDGKQNAGNEFLRAQIKNVKALYEPAQTFMCFQKDIVEALKQYIDVSHGGTSQQATAIPAEFNITGCWCDYIPATPFYKRHLSNHQPVPPSAQSPKGRPEIKAGEFVKDNDGWGNPIVYKALRVFCQYYVDDDGSKVWIRGCSPEEAGQQAFAAYCVGITENLRPQTIEPQEVITYQAPSAQPQPQPAPQVQQPVQQQAQPQFVQQPNPAQSGGQFAGAPF